MQNDHSDPTLPAALDRFWSHGYAASSVRDLIAATGSNRAALYSEFGGKDGLYEACFALYKERVVDPAFRCVEAPGAGLEAIAAFLEHQIAGAERTGFPAPGCLMANALTETAPHDARIRALVERHFDRLRAGFAKAIRHAAPKGTPKARIDALADFVLISAQGLWSYSRIVDSAAPLGGAGHVEQ